jgi:tetratricopeptide (TPR) repeat protein
MQGTTSRRNADLHLAIEHHAAGRLDEAESIYQQLYRADGRDAEVLYLMGVLCCDLGLYEPASRFLKEALSVAGAFPEARRQLAIAHRALAGTALSRGDAMAAEALLQESLTERGDDTESLNLLGLAQLQQEKFAAAEVSLKEALQLRPDLNQARNNLGLALHNQGRLDEARFLFEVALEQDPCYTNARLNLANTLRLLGLHQAARRELTTLLGEQPDSVDALNNLGAVAQDIGDAEVALACLSRANALAPDAPTIRWNLALTQLQLGDFTNGWRNFESRWEGCTHLRGGYGMPVHRAWRGERLDGKRLLLWAEQGFGDTLQFVRFATDAAARGATVNILVQPELAELVRGVHGISEVSAQGDSLPPYDFHCPLMSLPYRLQLPLEIGALHGATPYLSAAQDAVEHWRSRLSGYAGMKVGLVWTGSARRQNPELAAIDARRSISLQQLAPILSVDGCTFFSLQKGLAGSEVQSAGRVRDFSAEWTDFSDTAAFIANLDLVISVDTAVAHLTGALGKPVWLLNRYDSCWRWLLARNDSPWYATLRQFRQPGVGRWDAAIAGVALELAATAHRGASAPGSTSTAPRS